MINYLNLNLCNFILLLARLTAQVHRCVSAVQAGFAGARSFPASVFRSDSAVFGFRFVDSTSFSSALLPLSLLRQAGCLALLALCLLARSLTAPSPLGEFKLLSCDTQLLLRFLLLNPKHFYSSIAYLPLGS